MVLLLDTQSRFVFSPKQSDAVLSAQHGSNVEQNPIVNIVLKEMHTTLNHNQKRDSDENRDITRITFWSFKQQISCFRIFV